MGAMFAVLGIGPSMNVSGRWVAVGIEETLRCWHYLYVCLRSS